MATATTQTSIDVQAIHPKNAAKYSPNLHRWLTQRERKYRTWTSNVFQDRDGTLWIGMLDDSTYLIGCRLMQVLCNGTKAECMAYLLKQIGPLKEITDFWKNYAAIGRCAIDPEHKTYFVGDDTRWLTHGDQRECLWCGNHKQKLRRWAEPVARSAWEQTTVTASE